MDKKVPFPCIYLPVLSAMQDSKEYYFYRIWWDLTWIWSWVDFDGNALTNGRAKYKSSMCYPHLYIRKINIVYTLLQKKTQMAMCCGHGLIPQWQRSLGSYTSRSVAYHLISKSCCPLCTVSGRGHGITYTLVIWRKMTIYPRYHTYFYCRV